MKEEQIKEKNEKIEKIKSGLKSWSKLGFLYLFFTFLMWFGWNSFIVEDLGIGREVTNWWIFSFPTFSIFFTLRLLNPYWFSLIRVGDIIVYGIILFGLLLLL